MSLPLHLPLPACRVSVTLIATLLPRTGTPEEGVEEEEEEDVRAVRIPIRAVNRRNPKLHSAHNISSRS